MTNEQQKAKELAELLTAFSEGKQLQYKIIIANDKGFDWRNFSGTYNQLLHKIIDQILFRIKPETKRIALTQQDLIDRELSGKTISLLYSGTVLHISKYDEDGVFFAGGNSFSYEYMKDNYIFLDDTPCDKEVESE